MMPWFRQTLHIIFRSRTQAKRFYFENSWLRELTCKDIVAGIWQANFQADIFQKLSLCKAALSRWGSDLKSLHKRELGRCKDTMKQLRGSRNHVDAVKFHKAKQQFLILLQDHEVQWKQRAKVF
uniref:Uncharacterized protein n=1 Tax=Manihot esculenta TaxID=3983 RepID=A0A199UD82_MANES